MKWIRWGGFMAFVLVMAVMAGVWLLVLDGLVERTIEDYGTDLVGARVELAEADLTLIPAGLTLTGLQVTNPDHPMTNAVEVAQIALTLDGLKLFRRQIIVEEMTVEQVQFGTRRKTSGAVAGLPRAPAPGQPTLPDAQFALPAFDVPDVKTILAKENLETLQMVETLKQEIEQEKSKWEQRLKDLPSKKTFAKYRAKIEKLKNATKGGIGGILGGVAEAQTIKKEIEGELQTIKDAQKDFQTLLPSLKSRIRQIAEAPQADIRRLQDKYSLSPRGLVNLGSGLLGRQVGAWLYQAVAWYETARPIVVRVQQATAKAADAEIAEPVRASGVDIRFAEAEPLPEFLIRRARVSLRLELGDLAGEVQNVTPDQVTLGAPLTFDFSGENLEGVRSVSIKGDLNHVDPENPKNRMNFRATGYRMSEVALSDQPAWPVALKSGLANVSIRAELRGDALTANLTGNLSSLAVVAGKPGDENPLTRALSSAISGISRLTVEMDVSGSIEDYQVAVRSDLDRVMRKAAGRLVQAVSAELHRKLSTAVRKQVSGPIKNLQGSFSGLNGVGGELAKRLTEGNDLLGSLLEQGVSPQQKGIVPRGLPGGFKLPF